MPDYIPDAHPPGNIATTNNHLSPFGKLNFHHTLQHDEKIFLKTLPV